jgi:hypothetical protein
VRNRGREMTDTSDFDEEGEDARRGLIEGAEERQSLYRGRRVNHRSASDWANGAPGNYLPRFAAGFFFLRFLYDGGQLMPVR